MRNLLLEPIEYRIDETPRGVWRRYLYTSGELFEEFTSHRRLLGVPFLHFTRGKSPETGKRVVARGIIAIGRQAVGVVAIGQAALGLLALGQLAVSPLLGIGQAATGVLAVGQLALGAAFGFGQLATGYVAIGQIGFGSYVLAQLGYGEHVYDSRGAAPAAQQFFRWLLP
jgi:hypothetical protein